MWTTDSVTGGIRCPIFKFAKTRFLLSGKSNIFISKARDFALIIILFAAPYYAKGLKVWLINPLNRVNLFPVDPTVKNSAFCEGNRTVKIAGACNENEPFQFVTSAQEEISGIRIEITPLANQTPLQTDTIPAESIKVYRTLYLCWKTHSSLLPYFRLVS